jgi:hypothetical protein
MTLIADWRIWAMRWRTCGWLAVAILIIGCGSTTAAVVPTPPNPHPSCPQGTDTIDRITERVVLSTGAALNGCEHLAASEEVLADAGGEADGYFVEGTGCRFSQVSSEASSTGSTPPPIGVAHIVSRNPAGSVFRIDNAKAACTFPNGQRETLCGKATVYDGVPLQATPSQIILSCSSDPYLEVAVYRGSATITLDFQGGKQVPVNANQLVRIDPVTGAVTTRDPHFTPIETALFEVQAEALAVGLTISDYYRELVFALRSAPGSASIIAPKRVKAQFPSNYGSVSLMCQVSAAPVVFYPKDTVSAVPTINGAACLAPKAQVYGAAIYQPVGLTIVSDFAYADAGGNVVKHLYFTPAVTLSSVAPSLVATWNGDFDLSAKESLIAKPTYVARFLYTLGEDPTPNIGTVALTLGG